MKTELLNHEKTDIKISITKQAADSGSLLFFSIEPFAEGTIDNQLEAIYKAFIHLMKYTGFKIENLTAARFFTSDIINYSPAISLFLKRQMPMAFYSIIGQPPLTIARISMKGIAAEKINDSCKITRQNSMEFKFSSGNRHLLSGLYLAKKPDCTADSAVQTTQIFASLMRDLKKENMTIEKNTVRTWLYAPHVDADYSGIVSARRDLFDQIGLTSETNYIASTGIQGILPKQEARTGLEAYSIDGDFHVRYIRAEKNMSPTHVYGVTFERAALVTTNDLQTLLISGTASIDHNGEIVHPGNLINQTIRTLENITALLEEAGMSLKNLASVIVYLRDFADFVDVKNIVTKAIGNTPAVYVQAPVCRPGWLVEIEGVAVKIKGEIE